MIRPIPLVISLAAVSLVSLGSDTARGGTFVTWSAIGAGTADGVNVTAAYSATGNVTRVASNVAGVNFDPPGGANQSSISVPQDSSITWTFDQPVQDLLLYLVFWRGSSATQGGPPNGIYEFDQAPMIQSGLAGGSVNANQFLVTNPNVFYSGILSFPGTLTSLSLLQPQTGNSNVQAYTMSFNAVPESSTLSLLALAGCGAALLWRRRRRL